MGILSPIALQLTQMLVVQHFVLYTSDAAKASSCSFVSSMDTALSTSQMPDSASKKDKYQARIKDPAIREKLDDLIAEAEQKLGTSRGAETMVVERLLTQALADGGHGNATSDSQELADRLEDVAHEVTQLRKGLTKLREDFGQCTASLLVSSGVDPDEAGRWLRKYFVDAKLMKGE